MKKKGIVRRFYRDWVRSSGLISNHIKFKQTDILVSTDKSIQRDFLIDKIKQYRKDIEDYIRKDRKFLDSLMPIDIDRNAPLIVRDMAEASKLAGVGPMAAVAGAIAQYLGQDLLNICEEVIIENGGDIFLSTNKIRFIGIYAGDSPLSGKIRLKIEPQVSPLGICTSSGTVGHSLSFGKSDAAVVLAKTATLADAVATKIANLIQDVSSLNKATESLKDIDGIKGALLIIGKHMSVWGDVKITK